MRCYGAGVTFIVAAILPLAAQNVRPKDVKEIAKSGSSAIPQLQELLKNPDRDVRVEVVKQLIDIGTVRSLDPLIAATRDADPEVQVRATDGLVNFYVPGYVKTGFGASVKRVGTDIKGKFTDTNDQVIDAYITVRPEVITALATLVRGGPDAHANDARANAARALGVLRGKAGVPELIEAAHSKDGNVIYEALIALQKIHDESAGPRISFLLHDLDPKVQATAIETTGLLQNKEAAPVLADVLNRSNDVKVRRAALTAIAMIPVESSRAIYAQYLHDKDEKMRAAAAEGYARLRNPADMSILKQAWDAEGKASPRLSLAFAQVMDGNISVSEFSPLQFLINNLNSAAFNGIAFPFLVELARNPQVRNQLYGPLLSGTKDEKIGLSGVLAFSGDAGSVAPLQKLVNDPDPAVAKAAVNAVRNLQARL